METSRTTTLQISQAMLSRLRRITPHLTHESRLAVLISHWEGADPSQQAAAIGQVVKTRKPSNLRRTRGGAA